MKVIIVGAGIGGLVLSLYLHKHGIECEIYEQVAELQEVGVGVTLMPHAVTALADLDVVDAIDRAGIRTELMHFRTSNGMDVWASKRGLPAGYSVPQISLHRARLQDILYRTVLDRLPAGSVRLGFRFDRVAQTGQSVEATFRSVATQELVTVNGNVLVGADGIHSAARRQFYPDEGAPRWSGRMLWRGATEWPTFLDGKTIINVGGLDQKFLFYPIGPGKKPGHQLMNWASLIRIADDGAKAPVKEEWNREASRGEFMNLLKSFVVKETNIEKLVEATPAFWEFPMCDRDPLPNWSFGRCTLLGDAAHPMYPFGANGAAQAILDAQSLARLLAEEANVEDALLAYQNERLEKVNQIVTLNRTGGPDAAIDIVEARAKGHETDVNEILSYDERKAIVDGYATLAGFSAQQLAKQAP